jgi:chromosome segregation ATPase
LKQTADLRTELNKTMSQVVETEKRIQQLRQQLGKVPITIAQGEETDQNSVLISTLEARLVELELKEKELSAKYTKQSRRVLNVKDEIRVVREKLNKQEKKHFGRKRTGLNPNYQHLQATLYENEAELSALKAKAETQEGQLAEYQQKLEKLNKIEMRGPTKLPALPEQV